MIYICCEDLKMVNKNSHIQLLILLDSKEEGG